MNHTPLIVFCTTCKGRAQHIEKTLPRNISDNEDYPNCKFVVVDYGSEDHLARYLRDAHAGDVAAGRLVVYRTDQERFRMGHAKNMAHRCGLMERADILVNLDADNLTGPSFATYIAQQFQSQDQIFLWAKMIPGILSRGISGRIAVTANTFLKAGGYDEKYDTWGPDDKDFNARLRRLGYIAVEIDPKYLGGVGHNDRVRFREYKHVQTQASENAFEIDQSATIANWGHIGEGVVTRNFGVNAMTIGPLPTRIFGIGMHKTATTSLHAALVILGYDSAHWKTAHWAKAIWNQMQECGRSVTLERSYALCDLPIPALYRELDLNYPGSKFVLTIRSEEAWLNSVRNHWNPELNKFRAQWDFDTFTHRIHKAVYGQKGFDAELFLSRYRQHNDEVAEHFKDRPGDLLTMRMDEGAGWSELCAFLKRPIPNIPYPVAYATKKGESE